MGHLTLNQDERIGVVTAQGFVRVHEVEDFIRAHYPHLKTRYVLWDLLTADLSSLGVEELRSISRVARVSIPPKLGLRVAYVTDSHSFTTLMCIYSALATLAENPAEYSVFAAVSDARWWLLKPNEEPPLPVFLRTREALTRADQRLSLRQPEVGE